MKRRLLAIACAALVVASCDLNIGTTAPKPPEKCPPLDSALIKAQHEPFYPPWWCPLTAPKDSST